MVCGLSKAITKLPAYAALAAASVSAVTGSVLMRFTSFSISTTELSVTSFLTSAVAKKREAPYLEAPILEYEP